MDIFFGSSAMVKRDNDETFACCFFSAAAVVIRRYIATKETFYAYPSFVSSQKKKFRLRLCHGMSPKSRLTLSKISVTCVWPFLLRQRETADLNVSEANFQPLWILYTFRIMKCWRCITYHIWLFLFVFIEVILNLISKGATFVKNSGLRDFSFNFHLRRSRKRREPNSSKAGNE